MLGQLGLPLCVYMDTAPHPLECLPQAQPAGASSVPGVLAPWIHAVVGEEQE